MQLSPHEEIRLGDWMQSVDGFAWRAAEMVQPEKPDQFVREFRERFVPLVAAALRLPLLERGFSTVWPASVRTLLPSWEPGSSVERTWAPVLAWGLLRSMPAEERAEQAFDRLQLREALGAMFSTSGVEGEDVWRAAARVRVLLAHGDEALEKTVKSWSFWDDADVRWLAGVNVSDGKTYFNQEATDELIAWMMVPALLRAAEREDAEAELKKIEKQFAELSAAAKASGFELEKFFAGAKASTKPAGGGADAAAMEELPAEDVKAKEPVAPTNGPRGKKRAGPGAGSK